MDFITDEEFVKLIESYGGVIIDKNECTADENIVTAEDIVKLIESGVFNL